MQGNYRPLNRNQRQYSFSEVGFKSLKLATYLIHLFIFTNVLVTIEE